MGCLLAIDTSSRHASVAVAALDAGPDVSGEAVLSRRWYSENNHGAELMPAAFAVLGEAGLEIGDIAAIGVAVGPGGFTALRVGLSTAQGIALARGLPLVPVSTFDIEAAPWWDTDGDLHAVIDAGSRGVAWGRYERASDGRPVVADRGVAQPEELAAAAGDGAVYCGEATGRLLEHVPRSRILSGDPPTRDPEVFVRLALAALAAGEGKDPADVELFYARAPSTTTPRAPGAARRPDQARPPRR